MTLLSKASLVATPTAYGDGVLNSVKPTDGAGDFDFTRASSATRVNEQGLIEKERENLLLQSNQFDTTWVKTNSSVTSGQSGYDGSNDAWLLESTGASCRVAQTISASGVQSLSVYAKAGSVNWMAFYVVHASPPYVYFDLANGVLGGVQNNIIKANIQNIGSGWYRCSITFDKNGTEVRIFTGTANGVLTTASGDNIYIQDAQLEQGLVATDYIETTTTSVAVGITNNIPRINYENGIGNFLLEPQRTNSITQSEYVDSWGVKTNISVVSNDGTSPEGIINASNIYPTTTGACFFYEGSITYTSGITYTYSVFAKANGKDYLQITTSGASFSNQYCTFDLALGATDNNGFESVGIEDYGNGWYRCYVVETAISTASSRFVIGLVSNPNAGRLSSITPSGTDGVLVYGVVSEAGYLTSYIPSYGSATTRASETCNNAGNSDLFNDSEGVLYAEIAALDSSIQQLSISDSTTANAIKFLYLTSNVFSFQIRNSFATTVNLSQTLDNVTDTIKAAGKYKSGDFALWINGFEVATTSTGTIPTGMSELAYDDGGGGSPVYGKTKMVSTFKEALSDSELECLTSWSSFNRMATAQNYTIE